MMRKVVHTALGVCALFAVGCPAGPGDLGAAGKQAAGGVAVMDFELQSLDGRTLSPGDLGGDLVLVDFWATWCGPCHLQADILAKLYPEFRSRGIEFLAVSLGEPESVVRDFVAKRPFGYPVLIDPAETVATAYGLFVLPTLVLLDREGTVVYRHEGISSAGRLRSAVDQILDRQEAARSSS